MESCQAAEGGGRHSQAPDSLVIFPKNLSLCEQGGRKYFFKGLQGNRGKLELDVLFPNFRVVSYYFSNTSLNNSTYIGGVCTMDSSILNTPPGFSHGSHNMALCKGILSLPMLQMRKWGNGKFKVTELRHYRNQVRNLCLSPFCYQASCFLLIILMCRSYCSENPR